MKTLDMLQKKIDLIIVTNKYNFANGIVYFDNDDYDTFINTKYHYI